MSVKERERLSAVPFSDRPMVVSAPQHGSPPRTPSGARAYDPAAPGWLWLWLLIAMFVVASLALMALR